MNDIKIAIISDIHVGNARAKDLNPNEKDRDYSDDHFVKNFIEFVKRNNITADYLLVPGDMSHKGEWDEMELASSIIEKCAEALCVTFENILFVPGNHDVDWRMMERDGGEKGKYSRLRYQPLRDENLIFSKLLSDCLYDFYEDPFFSIKKNDEVLLLAYNSTWNDGPNRKNHFGFISKDHVKRMSKALEEHPKSDDKVKIFLVHHHPIDYSSPQDHIDFSAMQNSRELIDFLFKEEFDLFIHGHKHYPRLTPFHLGYGTPILILCAGSFCANLFEGWNGVINNQFHVINVEGRNKESQTLYGVVKSWTYLNSKWVESTEAHHGIEHKKPFGSYMSEVQLLSELEEAIKKEFKENGFLKWSKLPKISEPRFKYITTEQRDKLLDKLEDRVDFRRHKLEQDEVVLLKEDSDE